LSRAILGETTMPWHWEYDWFEARPRPNTTASIVIRAPPDKRSRSIGE
jgi:hypothetical protein